MKKILFIGWVILFLFSLCDVASAKKKSEVKNDGLTAYQKIFKGKKGKTVKGLMTVHHVEGQVYVEFPLSLLDKDMLLTSSIEDISDNGEGVVGQFAGGSLPFRFTKLDSTIQARISLMNMPLNHSSENNINPAIYEASQGGVYALFKILAYTPDSSAVVLDMTSLFMESSHYTNPFSGYAGNSLFGYVVRKHEYKQDRSFLKDVMAYDNNIMVTCELGFIENRYFFGAFRVSPGNVPVSVTVNKMLLLLPEKPMKSRLADPRVGTAFLQMQGFNSVQEGLTTMYIAKRWRIEPMDEVAYDRGELVEPKKPILFYMDTLMPVTWTKYIKAGFEAWNEAFEKIGFKNVIRVVNFPKNDPNFNANNIKYSTIRYAPLWMDTQCSMHVDPRTGEILNASFYVYDGFVSKLKMERLINTMASDPRVRGANLSEEIMGASIKAGIMREAGINLGLSLNAGASSVYPVDSLRSVSFTRQYGLSPSVMDLIPCNFIAQPDDVDKGVAMTQEKLGRYDHFVIQWLYRPIPGTPAAKDEFHTLNRWIEEAQRDPYCHFGRPQMHVYDDPTALFGDLGNDPVKALQYFICNLKTSSQHFYEWFKEGDADLVLRTQIYNSLKNQLQKRIKDLAIQLGGFYRVEVFSDDSVPSYTPVPLDIQKAVLKYMEELSKDLNWLENKRVDLEVEIRNSAIDQTREVILNLLFARLKYVALGEERGGAYTTKDYANDIYNMVWEGTLKHRALEKHEIRLQTAFVGKVLASSTITTSSGNFTPQKGIALVDRGFMPISDKWLDNSKLLARLESREHHVQESKTRSGFYPAREEILPGNYLNVSFYYDMLSRMQALLQGEIQQSSGETKLHYEYLLYKIKKAMKK